MAKKPSPFGKSPLAHCKYCGAPPSLFCKTKTARCNPETASEVEARLAGETLDAKLRADIAAREEGRERYAATAALVRGGYKEWDELTPREQREWLRNNPAERAA